VSGLVVPEAFFATTTLPFGFNPRALATAMQKGRLAFARVNLTSVKDIVSALAVSSWYRGLYREVPMMPTSRCGLRYPEIKTTIMEASMFRWIMGAAVALTAGCSTAPNTAPTATQTTAPTSAPTYSGATPVYAPVVDRGAPGPGIAPGVGTVGSGIGYRPGLGAGAPGPGVGAGGPSAGVGGPGVGAGGGAGGGGRR